MTPLIVVENSANAKLGPGVCATYRPVGISCPKCGIAHICYAQRGHVALIARRSAKRADNMLRLSGAPLVRHVVSGDWFRRDSLGRARLDREYVRDVVRFHRLNPRTIGWGYTHGWRQWPESVRAAIPRNMTILASVDSLEEAQAAQASGWRTARTTDDLSTKQANEVVCPVDRDKQRGKPPSTTCAQCRLCWESRKNVLFKLF